jgi:Photosynthetic reaction centre cytochrome C subunit
MNLFINSGRLWTIVLSVELCIISTSTLVLAQAPEATSASPHVHPPNPKPVNLHVLPKDIDPDVLHDLMHGYSGQLGVKCSHCHAPLPNSKDLDFASDTKPEKITARQMMAMTNDINSKYVAQALPTETPTKVSCGTCHRGQSKPEDFVVPAHGHEGH